MPITLGDYTFPAHIAVTEQLEELGGRDARQLRLQGRYDHFATRAELEAELDALLAAASASDSLPLSLREGRRYFTRRLAFKREISESPLAAAFTLQLEALPPFEESISEITDSWYFSASGAAKSLSTAGNVFALPVIELLASGTLYDPCFSDGTRAITFHGVVAPGETLIFDAPNGQVALDGEDLTPYTSGDFPRIDPGGVAFTYTDAPGSTHAGSALIRHRARWN